MTITKTQKIIGSIIILVIILALYVVFDRRAKNAETNVPANQNATTTTVGGVSFSAQGTGGYTVEQVPVTENSTSAKGALDAMAMSALGRQLIFKSDPSLTPEVKTLIQGKVSALQEALLKNPADFDSWINLGLYQKMAGDYAAASLSWQYAGKLSPTNFVSFGNLGDLYAYYLKDSAQAEIYYKKAITNGPTQSYLFVQFATVYRDVFKDLTKARAVVEQGLSNLPNDPSLLQLQASLK